MVRCGVLAIALAACGGSSSSELQRARANAAAALSPPPYDGVTRCGRPLPEAPPPTAPSGVFGL